MKRIISLSLATVICILSLLSLASCFAFKHPIDEFKNKMEKADSYQIILESSVLGIYSQKITMKVDGDIVYTKVGISALIEEETGSETYVEKDGDDTYLYTKGLAGKWTKTKTYSVDEEYDALSAETLDELFDPDNYEKVIGKKNKYRQKDGAIISDEFEDVEISLAEDTCVIDLEYTNGMTAKMKISKIGEVELKLPTVD